MSHTDKKAHMLLNKLPRAVHHVSHLERGETVMVVTDILVVCRSIHLPVCLSSGGGVGLRDGIESKVRISVLELEAAAL